ncbi:MAG: BRCT domain-containing protein [Proteobacteria bacterium]|nr:BRCT domain-containing protein [Pseudomonadota bacterium]
MRQAIEKLKDIVEAMVADGDLHDLEIEFLKAWLADNPDVSRVWPGSAVSTAIEAVLADGHVSQDERAYLLSTLRQLASGDFADQDNGDELALVFDNAVEINVRDALVCLAGEFLHGTRAACERLLESCGGWPAAAVTQNVRYLVVGAKVPADWKASPLGQTIQATLDLQRAGHAISIVSERRWLDRVAGASATQKI